MNKTTAIILVIIGVVVLGVVVFVYNKDADLPVGNEEERGAQDYNSSRSNKPRPVMEEDVADKEGVEEDFDEEYGKQEAQDYNSSRSNKPRPIIEEDTEDTEGEADALGGASLEVRQSN